MQDQWLGMGLLVGVMAVMVVILKWPKKGEKREE